MGKPLKKAKKKFKKAKKKLKHAGKNAEKHGTRPLFKPINKAIKSVEKRGFYVEGGVESNGHRGTGYAHVERNDVHAHIDNTGMEVVVWKATQNAKPI